MPDKKTNVLSQLLCVFRNKKTPMEDIVAIADKVVEEYIHSKNRLIHRKCRKNSNGMLAFSLVMAASIILAYLVFSVI